MTSQLTYKAISLFDFGCECNDDFAPIDKTARPVVPVIPLVVPVIPLKVAHLCLLSAKSARRNPRLVMPDIC